MRPAARLALLCALLGACPGDGLLAVQRAATPSEERAAFAELVRRSGAQFTAHDADGKQVDLGVDRWWDRARTIRLRIPGSREAIEHRLLAPENVLVLMRE
jgi:hypothetical protein